jgi:hypothetical protein
VNAGNFARVDEGLDTPPQVAAPIEIVLPIDRWGSWVRQNVRIGLLDFPVILEDVLLVILLGKAVLFRSIAVIVVLKERHCPLLET